MSAENSIPLAHLFRQGGQGHNSGTVARKTNNRKKKLKLHALDPRCTYCRATLTLEEATIDHIVPLSRGGSRNGWRNMVLSCLPCNQRKGDKLLDEPPVPPIVIAPKPRILPTKPTKNRDEPLRSSLGELALHSERLKNGGGAGSRTQVQKPLAKTSTRVFEGLGPSTATTINSPYLRERLITFCRISVTRHFGGPLRFIAEAIRRLLQLRPCDRN